MVVADGSDQAGAHWLLRLSATQWLAAADNEIDQAELALARRAIRPAVTHARRAAGMALNGILRETPEAAWPGWGRSYMEHVVALASDAAAPPEVRAAAAALRDTPPAPPPLVQLGRPDRISVDAARQIIAWARTRVQDLASSAGTDR
jgi:HEPN domain-containing protein